MATPIEQLDDDDQLASDEQHAALYEFLVGVASEAPPVAAQIEREEAA